VWVPFAVFPFLTALLAAQHHERLRKRIEAADKVECALTEVVVYRDAVVIKAVLTNRSEKPLRVGDNLTTRQLRSVRLTDPDGNRWVIPRLENLYQFLWPTKETSALVPGGGKAAIDSVDRLESPTLRPLKPPGEAAARGMPGKLRYEFRFWFTALDPDLRGVEFVYLTGGGDVVVVWKDERLPDSLQTRWGAGRQGGPWRW
jgi:hypothetical protein